MPQCTQCRHLLAEKQELKETNALLTEQLNAQRQDPYTCSQVSPPDLGKSQRRLLKDIKLVDYTCTYNTCDIMLGINILSPNRASYAAVQMYAQCRVLS